MANPTPIAQLTRSYDYNNCDKTRQQTKGGLIYTYETASSSSSSPPRLKLTLQGFAFDFEAAKFAVDAVELFGFAVDFETQAA